MTTPKPNDPDLSFWDNRRGVIRTAKGGLEVGVAVHNQGYSLLDDLVGSASFFQVLVLNATGRLPDRRLADWLEALFTCLSYPDARIWCNQMGSLAGTMAGSPVSGVAAGILASDSRLYGPGSHQLGVEFIEAAMAQRKVGLTCQEIVRQYPRRKAGAAPKIPGYVRPLIQGDERIAVMKRLTAKLGFAGGHYLALAHEIDTVMRQGFEEGMNLLGFACAFLCDQGFSIVEQTRLVTLLVSSGVHACYAEAADQPGEAFFPLRCEDLEYRGAPARPVPER